MLQGAALAKAGAAETGAERDLAGRSQWSPTVALLLLTACGGGHKEPTVDDAWVRLPAVPGRPGAGYFDLTGGATPRRLIAVESQRVKRVELHQSAMAGGRMTMRRLDGVDLAPGVTVSFKPEGNHLMMFGIDPALRPGDRLRLSFRYEKGQPTTHDARVVAAGDEGP